MFKFGILPKYEDPANKLGGDYSVFINSGCGKLKELWEAFVFDIVSQNFHDLDHFTGIRLTEKNDSWKFEFWVTYPDYMKDEQGHETYLYLKKKIIEVSGMVDANIKFNSHNPDKPRGA